MHYSPYNIAILGFGVEGQDAARYFLGQKSKRIAIFDRSAQGIVQSVQWEDKPLEWICGPEYLKDGIKGFDIIVRSPGFYRYIPEIMEAEKQGSKITSNTQLFFEESEANIIGITGTKGKGTTARMLQMGLEASGRKTLLLGNIGTPMLDRIDDADHFDWVILELSSFQLIDLPYSPPIAVVTNIYTDHLNWHKDRQEYIHAKENLWIHQKATDWAVFNKDDETCVELAKSAPGHVIWYSTKDTDNTDVTQLAVPGEHNVANALAALAAAKVAGADPQKAWEGICEFAGSEHRLEKVGEVNGVLYVNDSAATTPEAAIAGLHSFTVGGFPQPKILIAGGSLKGITFEKFAKSVKENNVKHVYLLGESASEIERELSKVEYRENVITGIEDMETIVKKASEIATVGDVVLLSPACASFGLFKNYQDRGEKFKKAVQNLRSHL